MQALMQMDKIDIHSVCSRRLKEKEILGFLVQASACGF